MTFVFSDQFDQNPLQVATLSTYGSDGGINILKTKPGFIHSITLSQLDAAPTAGDITIYDGVGTGIYGNGATVLFKHSQTTTVFLPYTVELNCPLSNGLAVGFTAPIKDVNVIVKYK